MSARILGPMVRLTFHKGKSETYLGAVLRIARGEYLEEKAAFIFSDCIDAGLSPHDAAWAALFECELLEFEVEF